MEDRMMDAGVGKLNILHSIGRIMRIIWDDRRMLIRYILIGTALGVVIAFSRPKVYKTTVVLAPEEAGQGFSGSISSIAAMVGMNLKIGQSGDAIYPEIYPEVLKSTDFIVSLFPVQVTTRDGKFSSDYATYLRTKTKYAWWSYPKRLLGKVIMMLQTDDYERSHTEKEMDPFRLTKSEWAMVKDINKNIFCSVNKKTNVITIKVADQDPYISACIADTIQARLQTLITDYRTKKARNDVQYLEQIFSSAEVQYISAQNVYANYVEGHSSFVRESIKQQAERLKSDLQLKENIYNSVAQQLQVARAKVQEVTPAFVTIQSASTPVKAANLPKTYVVVICMFLAVLARLGVLFWRKIYA